MLSRTASSSFRLSGDATADLLLGQLVVGSTTDVQWRYYRSAVEDVRPFVQDDWRVTKDLTLNLGSHGPG